MPETECFLLMDLPAAGAWNMAVDETLLEWSAEQAACVWRFYGWQEPTLSLGYFQDFRDRLQHPASANCAAVRRLTGGGAILHDDELTYSFVAPAGHPLAARRDELYETIHASLIEALAELGVDAVLCKDAAGQLPLTESEGAGQPTQARQDPIEPFLCFQRRTPSDVLLGSTKIAGSAQRRRRGAVLQHGSVLLGRSAAAPELAAMEDLTGTRFARDRLCQVWLAKLAGHLSFTWRPQPLAARQRHRAAVLCESRYAAVPWTQLGSRSSRQAAF
jgi:lipoate-protein ligase A